MRIGMTSEMLDCIGTISEAGVRDGFSERGAGKYCGGK